MALNGADSFLGRLPLILLYGAILISITVLTIQTVPDLSPKARTALFVLNVTLSILFAVEYGIRVWSAENRLRYVFSFWGIIDFLSILPMVTLLWPDSAVLRILHIFRALRLLHLGRMNKAIDKFAHALLSIREDLIVFVALSSIVLFLAAVGIYHFERSAQPDVFGSIPQSIWWAIVTLTTVGYGDAAPITLGGRVFTSFILLIGLGIVAIPAGLITAALLNPSDRTDNKTNRAAQHDETQPKYQGDT